MQILPAQWMLQNVFQRNALDCCNLPSDDKIERLKINGSYAPYANGYVPKIYDSLRYQDFIKIGASRNASLTGRRGPTFFFFFFVFFFISSFSSFLFLLLDKLLSDPFARTYVYLLMYTLMMSIEKNNQRFDKSKRILLQSCERRSISRRYVE